MISCSKEQGCTDIDATNFSETAQEDDGSCGYKGRNIIWYGKTTAEKLVADGATTLTYYVEGSVVGSSAASVYWTGSPNCGIDGSVTISKDLGNVKSKSFSYSVKDQTGYEYFVGTLNFSANTCEAIELIW